MHERRASLAPSAAAKLPLKGNRPQILISQASISETEETSSLFGYLRRASTQSVPVSSTASHN